MPVLHVLTLLLLPLPFGSPDTPPWGFPQHRVVCEIAWAELTPATRRSAAAILRAEGEYETFAESCVWADVRGARYHANHWVNVPPGDDAVSAADCPASGDCVLNNLEAEIAVLARSSDPGERARALMFIGHFVGDLHQPLHIGYEYDRGGNQTAIRGLGGGYDNLHKVWDRYFFREEAQDSRALARTLHADISAIDRTVWASTELTDWANESFRIVEDYVYDGLVEVDGASRSFELSADYEARNLHVAEMQLKKAGVRLGRLLNELLDPG